MSGLGDDHFFLYILRFMFQTKNIVTPPDIATRLRAIALAGTTPGSAGLLTAALLQQFLALTTTVHKGNLVCRMTTSLCDFRCKLATEMMKFVDKCLYCYGSRGHVLSVFMCVCLSRDGFTL